MKEWKEYINSGVLKTFLSRLWEFEGPSDESCGCQHTRHEGQDEGKSGPIFFPAVEKSGYVENYEQIFDDDEQNMEEKIF